MICLALMTKKCFVGCRDETTILSLSSMWQKSSQHSFFFFFLEILLGKGTQVESFISTLLTNICEVWPLCQHVVVNKADMFPASLRWWDRRSISEQSNYNSQTNAMKKARKGAITGISAKRMLQKVRTSANVLRQDSFSTCRAMNWDGKTERAIHRRWR